MSKTINRPATARLKFNDAAALLCLSRTQLERMVSVCTLYVQQDVEGGDRYLMRDELDVFMGASGTPKQRREAVRDFRKRKGRRLS